MEESNVEFIDNELEMKDNPSNSVLNSWTSPYDDISNTGLKQANTFVPNDFKPGVFANEGSSQEIISPLLQSNNIKKVDEQSKDVSNDAVIQTGAQIFNSSVQSDVTQMTSPVAQNSTPVVQEQTSVQSNTQSNKGMPSMIDMYGEVLTDKTYITNPAISRDEEINKMILALITPDKSALLVGKPGTGKTALVEGLAYRIHTNTVPPAIQGWRIIKINIPALLGKINVNGTEVSKLQLLIDEIDKVEKTILFIDEVHLLVAKNGGTVDLDFANMLKPYLDRGRILMIGATTSEEYESYILRDRAFVRRFIKIDIAELQGEAVVKVLLGTVPKFEQKMGVKMGYSDFQQEKIYEWIVKYTVEENRIYEIQNRYPDICLTIISSAFSYALFENAPEVKLKHFYLAMKNTNTIYPDRSAKAIEDFKVTFAQWLIKEGIDPKLI